MRPRSLARHAVRMIKNGLITFDSEARRKEGIRQLRAIINGVKKFQNDLADPIVEWHIGVYIPNFDYPLIQVDKNGEPLVWEEDLNYHVCGNSFHTLKGVGATGEKYYLSHLETLAPFRDSIVKVDRYTDLDRAAYALVSCMTNIINKEHYEIDYGFKPILIEHDEIVRMWKENKKVDPEFAENQHKLYISWLQKWIRTHGKNPETHMRVLRAPKKSKIDVDPFDLESEEGI